MRDITRYEFIKLERYTIEQIKIPEILLNENAAIKVIDNIDLNMRHSFAIICGVSKNGNYGLIVARLLLGMGKKVEVYLVDSMNEVSQEFLNNIDILNRMGLKLNNLETIEELENFGENLKKVNTLIDAVTGIEYSGRFQGPTEYIIEKINRSRIYTISIDIPSGMDYDTGKCNTLCVQPDLVVTFEYMKKGLHIIDELSRFKVVVENIGIPEIAKKYVLNEEKLC